MTPCKLPLKRYTLNDDDDGPVLAQHLGGPWCAYKDVADIELEVQTLRRLAPGKEQVVSLALAHAQAHRDVMARFREWSHTNPRSWRKKRVAMEGFDSACALRRAALEALEKAADALLEQETT